MSNVKKHGECLYSSSSSPPDFPHHLRSPVSRFEFTDGLSLKLGQVRSIHNLKPSGTPIEFVTELSLHYAGRV